ncbi:DUF6085 family protein [Streptomyces chartreusis]
MTPTGWVQGHCPACGHQSLFVADEGHLTCSWVECPQPDAAHTILSDAETEHIVKLDTDGWTVRHPLRERIGDALMTCSLSRYLSEVDQPEELGTFRARREDDAEWGVWSWERVR